MMQLLVIKEQIKIFYQKTSAYLNPFLKFFMAFAVFLLINQQLGFNPKLNNLPVALVLSAFCAFIPSALLVLLSMLVVIGHIFAASKILAALVAVIFLIMYCFFTKFTPNFGLVILAIPVLYFLKVPYCVPILLGLIATPLGIVPAACGVGIYFLLQAIRDLTSSTMGNSMEDILNLVRTVIDNWLANPNMIFAIFVFSAILIVTYVIRRQEFDYAFEIAILAGAVVNILGFLIGNIGFDIQVNLLSVILGTIGSAVIVYIYWFFRLTLDHTAIERIQFEDDDYYYYVKAVPKIKMTAPEKNIKKINEKK